LEGARNLMAKNERLSDMNRNPLRTSAAGSGNGVVSGQLIVMPPNPINQAALRYIHEHGVRDLDRAIEGLLKDLLAS
jgi:hypothetical protein